MEYDRGASVWQWTAFLTRNSRKDENNGIPRIPYFREFRVNILWNANKLTFCLCELCEALFGRITGKLCVLCVEKNRLLKHKVHKDFTQRAQSGIRKCLLYGVVRYNYFEQVIPSQFLSR